MTEDEARYRKMVLGEDWLEKRAKSIARTEKRIEAEEAKLRDIRNASEPVEDLNPGYYYDEGRVERMADRVHSGYVTMGQRGGER